MTAVRDFDMAKPVPAPGHDGGQASPEIRWSHRFADLGAVFSTPVTPSGIPNAHWVAWSERCANDLGLPDLRQDPTWLATLSGNGTPPDSRPIASVYSGHQFGVWAGQLGDGRALLLGELATREGLQEVQLKGAGRTPYSRMGDGRAVLRSSIREFLCSEAMSALGIPTTRALGLVGSALPVRRETVETAAIVTRVAPSFLRFGHFEHFTHTQADAAALQRLADYLIDTQLPVCRDADNPYLSLLEEVCKRTASLIAQWQAVGFCHGVMNTDNMSMLGLTIDYGPFGFLDQFNPMHVCNHSDHQGRYAYARQPNVAFWNLHALAQGLLPLLGDTDAVVEVLDTYQTTFNAALASNMGAKLGLTQPQPGDAALIDGLLKRMATDHADFTITFRRLAYFNSSDGARNETVRDLFLDRDAFDAWAQTYAVRLRQEGSIDNERAVRMNRVNPKFILRNHLAEVAIQRAQAGDFSEVERLLRVLNAPYDEQPEFAADADFPPEWAQSIEVSCSS